jgi:hypothetical protein
MTLKIPLKIHFCLLKKMDLAFCNRREIKEKGKLSFYAGENYKDNVKNQKWK